MKRLLIICGPTATGKTSLALYLNKLVNGEIISADSRQVYKYMDIGTGKEKPEGVEIHGYDLVTPDKEFSVKNYLDFALPKITEIYERGKLPILVGGTGLYIKALVDQPERVFIPRNLNLRKKLQAKSAAYLFDLLMKKNKKEAMKLNNSDKANSRRLIRILEVVSYKKKTTPYPFKFDDVFWIGLFCSPEKLGERIEKRVENRLKLGFEKEVEFLKRKGFWGVLKTTLGYRQWGDYLEGKITKDEAIAKWKLEEKKYSKRQITWFQKEKRINWFDITKKNWQKEVETNIRKWYLNENAEKSRDLSQNHYF